ncbi:MAG: hypothetical protein M1818_005084 [Claussenomyces sp. TS43310]|nr:MAG: hypothetical protein M1818_005084 [Claussenomyces sp. TS43310]
MVGVLDEPLTQNMIENDCDENDEALPALRSSSPDPSLQHLRLSVWLLTLSAGISGLLFGYDTGVISATLISIGSDLSSRSLTTLDKSFITASTSFCALAISPVSGVLADNLGRKRVILLADLLFILGALIQCFSTTVWTMILGRSVIGLAVGAASFVTPLYIAELAPAEFRGRLVTLNCLFITGGQVVAYLIGWAFAAHGGPDGWRWMVGIGSVPATFQLIIMVLMPESPRWLIKVGKAGEARSVLQTVLGGEGVGERTVMAIERDVEVEIREECSAKRRRQRATGPKDENRCLPVLRDRCAELFEVPGHRRALIIACLLQALQQLCGFNSLMYYSATLFSLIGFGTPTLTSLSVAVANLLFTIFSLLLIDALGRRRILLLSLPVMVFALFCCAFAFAYVKLPTDTNAINPSPTAAVSAVSWRQTSSPKFVLASIVVYVAAYAIGIGQIPWQQSELFPISVRSLGSSLATATNWGSNFIVGLTFLPMLELLSPTWTFVIYGFVCMIGWIAIWRIYPETMGLSLEATGALLSNGWGVGKIKGKQRQAIG